MWRLGAPGLVALLALLLGACLDVGSAKTDPAMGGHAGDASAGSGGSSGVEGGCWQAEYADCDGLASNGCETPLDTVANCGACGKVCTAPSNGTASCTAGQCVQSCNSGFSNCDNDWNDGCESLSTTTNCGGCGVACAGTCTGGACCKPDQAACGSAAECCNGACTGGTCCKQAQSDCTSPSECCVGYCESGLCCKPSGVACNQSGTCCSGSCAGGVCS